MTFLRRTIQFFLLFLGAALVGMFLVRWLAPDSRVILWKLLCPANTHIEIARGLAELEPGEIVTAYEVMCVGPGIRRPLSDLQLIFLETGFVLGLAVVLAVLFAWIRTRKSQPFDWMDTAIF
jgi:hypothetical protein